MSDENNNEEDLSIEEILDSIRQIISEDDEEGGEESQPEAKEAPPAPVEEPEPEEEVIELTDKIEEPKPEPEPEPEPTPEPEPEPEPEPVEEFEEPEPDEIDMTGPEDNEQSDDDNVLRGIAESAAMDGFEKLVKKTAIEYNGITIEEIVRTELKPLLREWLDDNLPNMIERLVQEELERVSKRVLGDN